MIRTCNALFAIFFTALLLMGCANNKQLEDGYQLGDGLAMLYHTAGRVMTLQELYCEESDPEIRQSMLRVIRLTYKDYPQDGFCTSFDTILDRLEERQDGSAPTAAVLDNTVMGKSTSSPVDTSISIGQDNSSGQ